MLDPTHHQPSPALSERHVRKVAAMPHAFPSLSRPRFENVAPGSNPVDSAAWQALKQAATKLLALQNKNGSVDADNKNAAAELIAIITAAVAALAPAFEHDAEYLSLVVSDFERWVGAGLV